MISIIQECTHIMECYAPIRNINGYTTWNDTHTISSEKAITK